MTTLYRKRVTWSGSSIVGPGVSTFYFLSSVAAQSGAVGAFFTSAAGKIAAGTQITVPTTGDTIDSTTGAINGSWSAGTGATIGGTNVDGYVLGTGCRLSWATSGIVAGRRVRGTTFLIPLGKGVFADAGGLDEGFRSSMQGWANTLFAAVSGDLVVWSRPTTSRAGSHAVVTGVSVPDQVSWLRSRRT